MLVAFFVGVWVVIGLVLFFIALRGGPRGARAAVQTQSRGGRRVVLVALVAIYVLIGVAIPAAVIAADLDRPEQAPNGIKLDHNEAEARTTFATTCGQCHTLNAARSYGTIGPNLDENMLPATQINRTIIEGKVAGNGTMPAGLLEGDEARNVACFVWVASGAGEDTSTSGEPPSPDMKREQEFCAE
jgi:mono/diheme cytochrome c family protein